MKEKILVEKAEPQVSLDSNENLIKAGEDYVLPELEFIKTIKAKFNKPEPMQMPDYDNNQVEPQVSLDAKLVQARKEKKEKFEKMIRDYTNNLLFGDQSQVMTYMLNFTNKLWDFVKENNLSN